MLAHKICEKHNVNSEVELDKFYIYKDRYVYCLKCQKERRRLYYLNNKEHEIKVNKLWKENNRERIKQISKLWVKNNPEKKNSNQRKYRKNRRERDPMFKVLSNLRTRIHEVLTAKHIVKEATTKKLTGCTLEYLKNYLEKKFKDGMSWDNYGQWHIDHIRPCASFNLLDPIEQKICFHYTNLQPLWAEDNLKKSNKENYYDLKSR